MKTDKCKRCRPKRMQRSRPTMLRCKASPNLCLLLHLSYDPPKEIASSAVAPKGRLRPHQRPHRARELSMGRKARARGGLGALGDRRSAVAERQLRFRPIRRPLRRTARAVEPHTDDGLLSLLVEPFQNC